MGWMVMSVETALSTAIRTQPTFRIGESRAMTDLCQRQHLHLNRLHHQRHQRHPHHLKRASVAGVATATPVVRTIRATIAMEINKNVRVTAEVSGASDSDQASIP